MTDVEKLIERLQKWTARLNPADTGLLIDDAAAMLRSLAAEKAKVEQQLGECSGGYETLCKEVASLRVKLEGARDTLRPFVKLAHEAEQRYATQVGDIAPASMTVDATLGMCRAARATLEEI